MKKFIQSERLVKPKESAAFLVIGTILLTIFHYFDAFDHFVAFLQANEHWELDEYIFLFMLGGVATIIIAYRRTVDLRKEVLLRQKAENRANTLARHDPLTGLANRRVLNEELKVAIEECTANNQECAVFLIDLDQFKPINDMYGHEAGDEILLQVSSRLRKLRGPKGIVARMGGDEFVCVERCRNGGDDAARIATNMVRELCSPYQIAGRNVEIGASIGIGRSPVDGDTAEQLLRAADMAMYDAKASGRRQHRFFHADMDEKLRQRNDLEQELRQAVCNDEIIPYFQPVFSLETNSISGFEALARWPHPERGLVPPDVFIPIAEDLGLIDDVMDMILRKSCIAAKRWSPEQTLSINISPVQFKNPWLCARIRSLLTEGGLAPSRLIVEVTENVIIEDMELASEVFATLQNMGIRIALDDFGKGYSSLSHLRELHFDQIKIDQSFVRSMDSADSCKIVSAVAGLGHALGMPVTAEGVETEEIANALRELGCERAQGYYFGRPLPDSADESESKETAQPSLRRIAN